MGLWYPERTANGTTAYANADLCKVVKDTRRSTSGSSEGSGTTPEVPDEPKDNSAVVAEKQAGYVQTNLTLSSAELEIQSMVDVPIHQEDLAVQRTPLIDLLFSWLLNKTSSTPTPPHTSSCSNVFNLLREKHFKRSLDVLTQKQVTPPSMCQTISKDAHMLRRELFHESKTIESYKDGMVGTCSMIQPVAGGITQGNPLVRVDDPLVGFNSLVYSFRALSTLRLSGLRTPSAAVKPCQGDSSKFYLITGIPTVAAVGQRYVNSQPHAHTSYS
ncbi:hypothetical protein Tco_0438282 [Tanacetum coccineum]